MIKKYSVKPSFLARYCLCGKFVIHVLTNGFGFDSSKSDWSIKFVQKVRHIHLSHTLTYYIIG